MPWPSQACADKLDRELTLYGNPPQFPEEDPAQPLTVSGPAASSGLTNLLNVDPQPSHLMALVEVSCLCAMEVERDSSGLPSALQIAAQPAFKPAAPIFVSEV